MPRNSHSVWIFAQQASSKIFLGGKFLAAAHFLGPESFGLVAIGLAALAIADGLSETGLNSGMIQHKAEVGREIASAVMSLQALRGLFVGVLILFSSYPVAKIFGSDELVWIFILTSVAPAVKGLINPGYILAQRDLRNKEFAASEFSVVLVDFSVCYVLLTIQGGVGAIYAVAISGVLAELVRVVVSWLVFGRSAQLTTNLHWAKDIIKYAKWIWVSSALSTVLNQFDKVAVAKMLGNTDFGMYHTTSRVSQLVVADFASAYAQYLFPRLASQYRLGRKSISNAFVVCQIKIISFSMMLAIAIFVYAEEILVLFLGKAWVEGSSILRVQSCSMVFGASIAVSVAYLKAEGRTSIVARSGFLQLILLVPGAILGVACYGSFGAALAGAMSITISGTYLFFKCVSGAEGVQK